MSSAGAGCGLQTHRRGGLAAVRFGLRGEMHFGKASSYTSSGRLFFFFFFFASCSPIHYSSFRVHFSLCLMLKSKIFCSVPVMLRITAVRSAAMVYNPFTKRLVSASGTFAKLMKQIGCTTDEKNSFKFAVPITVDLTPLKLNKGEPDGWRKTFSEVLATDPDPAEAIKNFFDRSYNVCAQAVLPPKLIASQDPTAASLTLTADQKNVRELARCGYNLYIGGRAGTGKTMLLRSVHSLLCQEMGLRVAVCATTGVAAVQIGGCTFHHTFAVPVKSTGTKWDSNALRAVDCVIVDEVSLLDASMLETFDREAQYARLDNRPFGGLQLILAGDFLQLSMGSSFQIPCFKSSLFDYFVKVQLVTPLRHRVDDPLFTLLSNLRVGKYDETLEKLSKKDTQKEEDTRDNADTQKEGTTDNNDGDSNPDANQEANKEDTIFLFPKRRHAEEINEARLQQLPGEEKTFVPQRGPLELFGRFTPTFRLQLASEIASGFAERLVAKLAENDFAVSPVDVVLMPRRNADGEYCCRLRHSDATSTMTSGTWEALVAITCREAGGRILDLTKTESIDDVPYCVSMALTETATAASAALPLRLKVGCKIMILRNLSRTVINGTVGTVQGFTAPDYNAWPRAAQIRPILTRLPDQTLFPLLPVVKIQNGEVFQIPFVSEAVGGSAGSYYYGYELFTLPISLGYAFTVHKVQGLTLSENVELDCTDFFRCDHLIYVACSRVRSLSQLTVKGVTPKMVTADRSALAFAESLADASKEIPVHEAAARGSWVFAETVAPVHADDKVDSKIA